MEIRVKSMTAGLDRLINEFPDRASRLVDSTADHIVNVAQANAVVRTGAMRASVKKIKKNKLMTSVVVGGTTAPYWIFIEYGTVKMRARPFFRPAVEEGKRFIFEKARELVS